MWSAKLTSSANCSDFLPNPDSRLTETDLYWPESPPPRTSQRNPPEITGYRPKEANTTQELNTPPSSLPGMPPGELEYSSDKIRRTVCCVFHGAPAKAYIQGLLREGSLPINANSLHGPALSCRKWRSRRAMAALSPPLALNRARWLNLTMSPYWAPLPSTHPSPTQPSGLKSGKKRPSGSRGTM